MKEKKIILFAVIAVIIATLLYVVYAYTEHDHDHEHEHNHESGKINIEQTITDEEHEYGTECSFTYGLPHWGDHEIDIIVTEKTKIIVESMECDNPCMMTLSKDGNNIWTEQMVEGKEMGPGIGEGEYKLLMEYSEGNGKGKVVIDDGEEHEEDHDHEDHDHDLHDHE